MKAERDVLKPSRNEDREQRNRLCVLVQSAGRRRRVGVWGLRSGWWTFQGLAEKVVAFYDVRKGVRKESNQNRCGHVIIDSPFMGELKFAHKNRFLQQFLSIASKFYYKFPKFICIAYN